jgi:hypothetical protein
LSVGQQPGIETHFRRQGQRNLRRVDGMFTHFIAVTLMQHHAEAVKAQDQRGLFHYCL